MRVLFPQLPRKPKPGSEDVDMFDPKENMVRAAILREANTTGSEDEDSDAGPETAIQRTFDPDNMLKRDLVPKCVEAGIPYVNIKMCLSQIKAAVRKFFTELHHSEGTTLHQSDCYVAQAQSIERKRKETTEQKTKNKFAAKIARKENPLKVSHPNKKKGLGINGKMAKFPDKGFYIAIITGGERVVRCGCNQKIISGEKRDYCSILKHVERSNKHLEYIKKRKELS
jgi:hypothetical protein